MKSRLFIKLLLEVRQTGESIDTRDGRQEVEPFGQSIRTTPPLEEEPPANPVPIIGDSLFPEWQCALPTELIPTHCALKMIADIKGGGLWLGPINTKNKEGNAAGITHELPHLKSTNETFGRSVALKLSSTLTASTKPDRPVGPEDCPKDQNGKYSASCDVNSGGPVLDDSFVDASIEGGGDPLSEPPQLTVQESIAAIIGAARNAVSDGRKDKNGISCADIFNDKAIEFLDAYEKSMSRNGALRFGEKTADGENMKNAYAGTSPFKTAKVNGKDYSIITMNTKNEFFDSDKYDSSALPTGYRHLSFEQFWAVTLLHEIGHAISNSGTKTFIENDAGNVAASIANFKFVVDSCFKAQTK